MANIIVLEQTCECCPEQYWAYKGSHIIGYIRLRWGHLTCDYLPNGRLTDNDIRVLNEVFNERADDQYKGSFDTTEEREYWLSKCKEALLNKYNELKKEITMTPEDKELLLIDLCARLPYHVRCKIWLKDGTTEEGLLDLKHNYGDVLQDAFYYNKIKDIKPYLRPMSSMTEEEQLVFSSKCELTTDVNGEKVWSVKVAGYDWLNAHHFDYRGLIEKGLALEAPEGMYK